MNDPKRGPKFGLQQRVIAGRHGPGKIKHFEFVEGFGYVYLVVLDSGYSTGGMVQEKRIREIKRTDFGPCCPCSDGRHQDCILGPCECLCERPEPKESVIAFGTTDRNFTRGEFKDGYGKECSVQDSSVATEHYLWLGIERPEIKTFREGEGWKDLPLPDDAHVFSRMHLTVSQAKAVRDALDRFIETGSCEP